MKMHAILPWPQRGVTSKVVRPYHPIRFVWQQAYVQKNAATMMKLRRIFRNPGKGITTRASRADIIRVLSEIAGNTMLHTGNGCLL